MAPILLGAQFHNLNIRLSISKLNLIFNLLEVGQKCGAYGPMGTASLDHGFKLAPSLQTTIVTVISHEVWAQPGGDQDDVWCHGEATTRFPGDHWQEA